MFMPYVPNDHSGPYLSIMMYAMKKVYNMTFSTIEPWSWHTQKHFVKRRVLLT
jgi:hypothetical protein